MTSEPGSGLPHSGALTVLVATTNQNKLSEICTVLDGLPIDLRTLAGFPSLAEPDEHGSTFAENARLKAIYYARATGVLTVAEDSGLEIDALDGAPGVQSARYNGGTYPEKFEHLYRELRARGATDSPARFVCALAVARGEGVNFEARGTVEGRIAMTPRGEGGFGYDPIFFYPPCGRTLAELSKQDKAEVSHRGKAFRKLREFLICARMKCP